MGFDFDALVDRRGTYSLKWDVKENELPMWVADMDFPAAPPIREALEQRVAHGVFGYSIIPDEWYDAYIGWWKRRHQFKIQKDWLIFCTGVVPAISSAVRKLTTPAENVVVLTPVYNIFFNSIFNNGRNILECPLKYDGTKDVDDRYEIDFEDLEEKLSLPQTTMLIFCNPHNPVGKIWEKETLQKVGELCKKHHVVVLSDEIHCDLTAPGKEYIPFASVSDTCREVSVTCIAPTKAFNIAGLQTAAVVVPDEFLRNKMNRALNTDEVAEPNAFAMTATIAAFTKGEEWLDALREYVQQNKNKVVEYLEHHLPKLKVTSLDVTYLLWIDVSDYTDNSKVLAENLRADTGLYVSEGEEYGGDGRKFIRLNVACPRSRLEDGLERLKTFGEHQNW
ncbi:MAG: pyridoxal phosphate-dependent aminotransferase [Acetatifactor sp.]|nr:pyridoxal phosphate-dependent aminotransferase [Acetatifactor sp.]